LLEVFSAAIFIVGKLESWKVGKLESWNVEMLSLQAYEE
jgi:hypothetical protein